MKAQPELPLKERCGHGGARKGAGRKRVGPKGMVPHRVRAAHRASNPLHVTLRAREGLPSLRRDRLLFEAMRGAIAASHKPDFRVVHFSIQSNHMRLLVEAESNEALSRGMNGLTLRMVHAAHRALGTQGALFADRYHAHALRSPREIRNALLYVLQNHPRHS